MTLKTIDKKLARQLQARGTWDSYQACLRRVQQALTGKTTLEVRQAIDRGELDPLKMTKGKTDG